MKKLDSVLNLIGNTPAKRLDSIAKQFQVSLWAKLENLNPSGSIKDRIALQMIEDAEKSGNLKQGYTIIESSSGNTAIALSFVGGLKGYKRIIFMPKIMANEKVECKKMEESTAQIWWARQFSNPSNYKAHRKLGGEILSQFGDKIDAFVASVGTGGTLFGVAQVLKVKIPRIRIIAVEPEGCPYVTLTNFKIIEGVTGGILKEILDSKLVDSILKVTDRDAIDMTHRLIQEEGLFVGISSGANVFAGLQIAKEMGPGSNILTVLPDRGDRYITSEHYVT